VFSVKHNRNGFAAFGKIPAMLYECFEIFVAVLFCRGDSVRVNDIMATIGVDSKATIDTKLPEKEAY
jgi:hypothetical protein